MVSEHRQGERGQWLCSGRGAVAGKEAGHTGGVDQISKYINNIGSHVSPCCTGDLDIRKEVNENEHFGFTLILEMSL